MGLAWSQQKRSQRDWVNVDSTPLYTSAIISPSSHRYLRAVLATVHYDVLSPSMEDTFVGKRN